MTAPVESPQRQAATRAKEHLPTVLLTVLSIVQAIALELVWTFVSTTPALYVTSFESLVTWVQVATTLLGIVLIWLGYSTMVMRLVWVPSTSDSILPFAIGLIEFVLIAQLGIERLGPWFLALGVAYGLMQFIIQHTMRRAREDPDNADYFTHLAPAEWRDLAPMIALTLFYVAAGAILFSRGERGPLALATLLVAAGATSWQLRIMDRFWRRSIGLD